MQEYDVGKEKMALFANEPDEKQIAEIYEDTAIFMGEDMEIAGAFGMNIPLKNKGAIRLTVSKYYLPSGKSISEVGVSPDIEIDEENDDFRIKSETDNQLEYAIKLLKG